MTKIVGHRLCYFKGLGTLFSSELEGALAIT